MSTPLSVAEFWARLRIRRLRLDLTEAQALSRTGAGEVLSADLGPRLWAGAVTLAEGTLAEQLAAEAALDRVREAGVSFLLTDRRALYPAADPHGLVTAGLSPRLAEIGADNRTVTLEGLAPGFVLSAGDKLGFTYGADPLRYALHRLATGAIADAAGVAAGVVLSPAIRPGAVIGGAVRLGAPLLKAVFDPGSFEAQTAEPGDLGGLSFRFVQTLR